MTGLSSQDAARLLSQQGPNEIEEKRPSAFNKFVRSLSSPASLMLVIAAALSFMVHREFDGYFIFALLFLNVGMTLWHERKADNALEELRKQLSVTVRVLRDGGWRTVPSREVVVGDYVECGVGTLVPADMHIEEAKNLAINEAVLTGESLPKDKQAGDTAYSGSVVVTGVVRGHITATGSHTFFGKTALSAGGQKRRSAMETDILSISRFLIIVSMAAALLLTSVYLLKGQTMADILILDLSLFIAGIPVSLPAVMTLIISLGAIEVARKKALVRRLSALEDLANVSMLLTDKTGTLTKNRITVEHVTPYAPFNDDDVRRLAADGARGGGENFIDRALVVAYEGTAGISIDFIPGDSERKHSTALVESGGKRWLVSIGMPAVVGALCADDVSAFLRQETEAAAHDGSRAIAIAVKADPAGITDEHGMHLAGVLVLADPLRNDAKETLAFLRDEGVRAVMLTGDTKETAAHVSHELGLIGSIATPQGAGIAHATADPLDGIASFAEVFPADKLALVEAAQKRFAVAVTGDGVNDLPAVRKADVGIAVENAVDALKGSADIVLLDSGIAVLQTALVEARKIFFRLYNYSVYRISESFRLIISILILGLLIGDFPLTPVQIILLAFLNDIPIITLAFDRVKRTDRPADLDPKERFLLGMLYGSVGVGNSLLLFLVAFQFLHVPLAVMQTMFFLKLTVSGHMLIYVAHTRERWWRFLPAPSVVIATTVTQFGATVLALFGIFTTAISWQLVLFVWVWSFAWMQVSDLMKRVNASIVPQRGIPQHTSASRV